MLRYKVKKAGSEVLEASTEEIVKPKLHYNDLATLEDELKPEFDVLNSLVKKIRGWKEKTNQSSDENRALTEALKSMKADLNGEQTSVHFTLNYYLHNSLESQQKLSQLLQSQSSEMLHKSDKKPAANHIENVVSVDVCFSNEPFLMKTNSNKYFQ